jgi:hypothetical protein
MVRIELMALLLSVAICLILHYLLGRIHPGLRTLCRWSFSATLAVSMLLMQVVLIGRICTAGVDWAASLHSALVTGALSHILLSGALLLWIVHGVPRLALFRRPAQECAGLLSEPELIAVLGAFDSTIRGLASQPVRARA